MVEILSMVKDMLPGVPLIVLAALVWIGSKINSIEKSTIKLIIGIAELKQWTSLHEEADQKAFDSISENLNDLKLRVGNCENHLNKT